MNAVGVFNLPPAVSVERVEVVPQDREKPTLQIGAGLEAVEVELGADNRFLDQIVCRMRIARRTRLLKHGGSEGQQGCRCRISSRSVTSSSAQVAGSNLITVADVLRHRFRLQARIHLAQLGNRSALECCGSIVGREFAGAPAGFVGWSV